MPAVTIDVRDMDSLGRFVIPKSIRAREGLEEGTKLEILYDENAHTVVLRRYRDRYACVGCGLVAEYEDAVPLRQGSLCSACQNIVKSTNNNVEVQVVGE